VQRFRILGIDPGSRLTGYGCIDVVGKQLIHVAHGTLKLANTSGKAVIPLEDRLLTMHAELSKIIAQIKPTIFCIEKVFFAKNAVSALKLGQARGAAILTGKMHGLQIVEYSPNEVKQSLVGQGHAAKEQVAEMVKILIGHREFSTTDASDALALAICHAHHLAFENTAAAKLRQHSQAAKHLTKKTKRVSLAQAVGLKKL